VITLPLPFLSPDICQAPNCVPCSQKKGNIVWVKLCFIHYSCCVLQDKKESNFEEEEEEK